MIKVKDDPPKNILERTRKVSTNFKMLMIVLLIKNTKYLPGIFQVQTHGTEQ